MTQAELKLKIATALDNAGLKATKDQINGLSKDIKSFNKTTYKSGGGALSKLFSGTEVGKLAKLGVAVGAVSLAIKGFIGVCKLTSEAVQKAFNFQYIQHQFKYLYGSMEKAKSHMKDLQDLGSTPPFSLEEFAQASRKMTIFSDGALGMKASLKLVGDAAAASGQSVEVVGEAVAKAYAQIRDGEPVKKVANSLKNLGLITPATVSRLENLQKSGVENKVIWEEVTKSLAKFNGAMKETENTAKGSAEALKTAWENIKITIGTDSANAVIEPQKRMKEAVDDLQPIAQKVGKFIGDIKGKFANARADLYEGVASLLTGKSPMERELERIKKEAQALEAEEKAKAIEKREQDKQMEDAASEKRAKENIEKVKGWFKKFREDITSWAKTSAKEYTEGLKKELEGLKTTQKEVTNEYNKQTEAVKRQWDYVQELKEELKNVEEQQKNNLGKGFNNWKEEQKNAERQEAKDEKNREKNKKRAEDRLKLLESRGGIFGERGLTDKEKKEVERLRKFIGDEAVANAKQNLEDAKERFRIMNDKAQQQLDKLGDIDTSINDLTKTLKKLAM